MAITDMSHLSTMLASPFDTVTAQKNALTAAAGRLCSLWPVAPFAGFTPTGAATLSNSDGGALGGGRSITYPSNCWLGGADIAQSVNAGGMLILADRLSHQGGLSGTVTGEVTTNLPTATLLNRYTDGVGVMAGIEIYTQLGSTTSSITCTYTDQDGNSSTSQPCQLGNTGFREVGRMILINLEAGDTGVRAITASNLSGTTGTAGAFGYTLFKPLAFIPVYPPFHTDWHPLLGGGGQFASVSQYACLFWLWVGAGNPSPQGTIKIVKE